MAYSENILPKEAAYYTLSDATIVDGRLSMKAGGSAKIKIDTTLLISIPDSILVNLYTDRLLNPLATSVIMFLDIVLEDDTIQQIGIYPNQLDDKALSFPIVLTDGAYKSCELCIQAYIDCDLLVYELCPKQESDVETIIEGVKQSLPHVLYDYNEDTIISNQTESTVAMIACLLQGNTDVNGHFLMHFYSTEQCDVYLRFYDNEVEELYAPLKYTVNPGFNSLGVPHAYLKRLAGIHNFIVTCQCTNGILTMYTRDILFTIDAGYLASRLIDVGMLIQDLSFKHLTLTKEPEEIWAIGIDAQEILVKKRPFGTVASAAWTAMYSFSDYRQLAMEFNGAWTKIPKQTAYTIITEEEPYIFGIDFAKNLYVWIGNNVDNRIVLDINVDVVHALRGYSSTVYPEQDQGLICAYLKEGKIWYRSFSYFNGGYTWSRATELCSEDTSILDFSIHRLNDYRVGIAYTTNIKNYWAISDRIYVNQAVPSEEEYIDNIVERPLSSMTLPTQKFNGTPCTFEDPTAAQQEFIVTYELPLAHFIEEHELEEKLAQIFTFTVNGVVPEGYTLSFNDNTLCITLREPAAATRDSNCNIKLVITNNDYMVFLRTSNNGHGVPIVSETFNWVIERPVVTTIVENVNKASHKPQVVNASTIMRPIAKTTKRVTNSSNIQGQLNNITLAMHSLKRSKQKILSENTITPNLVTIELKCTQTGVKPI